MGNVPERIWATEDREHFGEDRFHSTTPMRGLTEYLRADIAAAREADLRAEVERIGAFAAKKAAEASEMAEMLAPALRRVVDAEAEAARLRGLLDEARKALSKLDVGEGWAAQVARATIAKIGGQHD